MISYKNFISCLKSLIKKDLKKTLQAGLLRLLAILTNIKIFLKLS